MKSLSSFSWVLAPVLVSILVPLPAASAAEVHVSPGGNDAWSGTLGVPNAARSDGPFATLERARDALRAVRTGQPRRVIVHGGTYSLSRTFTLGAEDSGTATEPALWCVAPEEEVRLSGGVLLPASAFRRVAEPEVVRRLDPAARDHVLVADLAALSVPDSGPFPPKFRGPTPLFELHFDDRRMTLSRWPDEGWATVAKIVESGSIPREGDESNRPGVFEYSGERPARWNPEVGVWLQGYWCFDWYEEVLRVASIDRETRRVTFAVPHLYGMRQGNPSPRRYCALNLLEELDRPGEYSVDVAGRKLYFWLPSDPAKARIVLATLPGPVVALEGASNVTLRGFIVEAGHADGIRIQGGENCRLEACIVRNIRQLGIRVEGGTAHRVEACDIHDTGTGGLFLSGGDRRTLSPAGHAAINNHIWLFSKNQLTYALAIQLEGVGNRAAHNLLHDAPHGAVVIGGNDHVFELNVVHHVCLETDDCGALYKGRNPSCRGNVIRHNYWYDIGPPMGHGSAAVYFDDGDGGDMVLGNVFLRAGDPGRGSFGTVFSHGGHDNLAEGNIFIDCRRALGSAPWNDVVWKDALGGGQDCFFPRKLLEEVDITKPPYTVRYPELRGFLDWKPGQPRENRARRNLFVRCGEVKSGNWQMGPDDVWSTEEDPGFVDAAKGDYRLRPDAEVFRRIPGFQPIPFEKIGLYTDELRRR